MTRKSADQQRRNSSFEGREARFSRAAVQQRKNSLSRGGRLPQLVGCSTAHKPRPLTLETDQDWKLKTRFTSNTCFPRTVPVISCRFSHQFGWK